MSGVDLRTELIAVRDQGARPTCLSFASSAAHEHLLASREITTEALSVEALYVGAQTYVGAVSNTGLTFESIRGALDLNGQPRETDWPYGDAAASTNDPEMFCCGSELVDAADIHSLRGILESRQLLVGGFALTKAFVDSSAWMLPGVFELPVVGLHAMAMVGHTVDQGGQLDGFILRNSWGTNWGDKGYACMPLPYFSESCRACFQLSPP